MDCVKSPRAGLVIKQKNCDHVGVLNSNTRRTTPGIFNKHNFIYLYSYLLSRGLGNLQRKKGESQRTHRALRKPLILILTYTIVLLLTLLNSWLGIVPYSRTTDLQGSREYKPASQGQGPSRLHSSIWWTFATTWKRERNYNTKPTLKELGHSKPLLTCRSRATERPGLCLF